MRLSHPRVLAAFAAVLLTSSACRPILTIGWQEIGILLLILVVLMGPALYRLLKRLDAFRNWQARQEKEQPDE